MVQREDCWFGKNYGGNEKWEKMSRFGFVMKDEVDLLA